MIKNYTKEIGKALRSTSENLEIWWLYFFAFGPFDPNIVFCIIIPSALVGA